jgi:hypothetical protein
MRELKSVADTCWCVNASQMRRRSVWEMKIRRGKGSFLSNPPTVPIDASGQSIFYVYWPILSLLVTVRLVQFTVKVSVVL